MGSVLALGVTLGTVAWLRASTVPPAPVVVEEAPVAQVVIDAGTPVTVKVGKRPVKKPPPQVDCSVPWELDAAGNRIFKRDCLK